MNVNNYDFGQRVLRMRLQQFSTPGEAKTARFLTFSHYELSMGVTAPVQRYMKICACFMSC